MLTGLCFDRLVIRRVCKFSGCSCQVVTNLARCGRASRKGDDPIWRHAVKRFLSFWFDGGVYWCMALRFKTMIEASDTLWQPTHVRLFGNGSCRLKGRGCHVGFGFWFPVWFCGKSKTRVRRQSQVSCRRSVRSVLCFRYVVRCTS